MISWSVVQAEADLIRMNGLPLTRRGAGRPMWPPADWTNLTQPSPISGSAWSSGYCTAAKAISREPSLMRVTPMRPSPE